MGVRHWKLSKVLPSRDTVLRHWTSQCSGIVRRINSGPKAPLMCAECGIRPPKAVADTADLMGITWADWIKYING